MAKGNESARSFKRGSGTLQELLRVVLDAHRLGIRTMIPASVATYDPATQKAKVILGILTERYSDDGTIPDLPKEITVPVHWPRTGLGYLTFPLVPGDTGHVAVCDRSLEKWLVSGVPTVPGLRHTHNPIDGVFFPGLHPATSPITPPTSLLATVLEGTAINIGATAVEPAVKATTFVALMDAMLTAALAGAIPQDGGIGAFTQMQIAWNAAKANISTTKAKVE